MALLLSQGTVLANGINAFEPYIYRIHSDYNNESIIDWPTVILATTLQTSAISLTKLLPTKPLIDESRNKHSIITKMRAFLGTSNSDNPKGEVLDRRSIATLVRNFIDTHDVLEMMLNAESPEEFDFNRNILGLYVTSRINKVQTSIDELKAEKFYKHSNKWYWDKIKASPLYNKSMERLKTGEGVFYKSRRDRVLKICGDKNTDFVLGVLADLSTYVHSIPPAIWLSDLESLYSDTEQNRGIIAIWVRIANFYFAQSIKIIIESCGYEASNGITQFINYHRTVFSPSE